VIGDQLELELNDARLRIPWGGRSLRSLTKCGKLFILEELPTGGQVEDDPQQLLILLKGGPHGSKISRGPVTAGLPRS